MDDKTSQPVRTLVRSELRYQVTRIAILALAFLFPLFMIMTVAIAEGKIEMEDLAPISVMLIMFGGMPGFFLLYMQQEAFFLEKRSQLFGILPITETTIRKALYRLTLIELIPSILTSGGTVIILHLINPEIPLMYALGIAGVIAVGILIVAVLQSSIRARSYRAAQGVLGVGLFLFVVSLNLMRLIGLDWLLFATHPLVPIAATGLVLLLARVQTSFILKNYSRR